MTMSSSLAGQQLESPKYRPHDARARAARVLDSIFQLDEPQGAVRRAVVDTTLGGAVWIEFEPAALPSTSRTPTPQGAAASFLEQYGAKVFGIGPAEESLELLAERAAGSLTHRGASRGEAISAARAAWT
jgi:hypothetical protein